MMEPALFSAANLFDVHSSDDSGGSESENGFVQRDHAFPGGMVLKIREFEFHQVNANLLWPGTCMFSEWLFNHLGLLNGRRILELGSGTGALTIFLKKAFNLDITTSDYDDEEIEHNIAFNCQANGVAVSPHIRHTWGDDFPVDKPGWDLILASDILLYVKQYPNLITTLTFLLLRWNPQCTLGETQNASHHNDQGESKEVLYEAKSADTDVKEESEGQRKTNIIAVPTTLPKPCFLMSWRRRIPKQDEDVFFNGCRAAGSMISDLVILAIVLPAASKISFMGQSAAIAGRCGNLFRHCSTAEAEAEAEVEVEEK